MLDLSDNDRVIISATYCGADKPSQDHMFEKLYEHPFSLARHKTEPYFKERETFLAHLAKEGYPKRSLIEKAGILLWVSRTLNIHEKNGVTNQQITQAARRWIRSGGFQPSRYRDKACRKRFQWVARQWLKYLGCLKEPVKRLHPWTGVIKNFVSWMEEKCALSPATVHKYCRTVEEFFKFHAARRRSLSRIRLFDVDAYLKSKGRRVSRRTMISLVPDIRAFVRYGIEKGWYQPILLEGLQAPRRYRYEGLPVGPTWNQVRLLLRSTNTRRPTDIRDRAVLLLFALYGLRAGEVCRLRLEDIDWERDEIRVWRPKSQHYQVYPLLPEVGKAIATYLYEVRPRCHWRELFLRRLSPSGGLTGGGIYHTVALRYTKLGIKIRHRGPHSLRHACATQLLVKGASLQEIAKHLGHRDLSMTQIYTKVDLKMLREVAAFDLGDLP